MNEHLFAAIVHGIDSLLDSQRLRHDAQDLCAALDPNGLVPAEALAVYDNLAKVEKLVAGAKLRLSARAAEAGSAARNGQRSAADDLAKRNGTSKQKAQDELDTSKRLGEQPDLDEALANGELSPEQANTISDAAEKDPTAEKGLIEKAKTSGLGQLKDEAAKVKANADSDAADRRKRIHAGRAVRRWLDRDGFTHLDVRGHAEDIAKIEARLAPYTNAAYDKARQAATYESHDAYRYDGFMAMIDAVGQGTDTPKGASRYDVKSFVHVDLESLRNGRTGSGSICYIDRLGPVDLDYVRSVLGDSFVTIVLKNPDGTIHDVINLGRQANASQRSFLEALGLVCSRPDCNATHGLEIDHTDDWADTHRTEVDKLALLCDHDHDLKTHHGYRLTGPPGNRTWWGPDGQIISQDRPPPSPEAGAEPPEPAEPQHQLF